MVAPLFADGELPRVIVLAIFPIAGKREPSLYY